MCEANVYIVDSDGNEVLILDAVNRIIPDKDEIYLENIFSERKTIKARIKEMELINHRIILEKLEK